MTDEVTITMQAWQWLAQFVFACLGVAYLTLCIVAGISAGVRAFVRHEARKWGE